MEFQHIWLPDFKTAVSKGTLIQYCAMGARKIFENIFELLISDKRLYFRKKNYLEESGSTTALDRSCRKRRRRGQRMCLNKNTFPTWKKQLGIPTYLVARFQNCGVQGTLKRYCAMGTRKILENIIESLISDKRLYFRKKRPCLFQILLMRLLSILVVKALSCPPHFKSHLLCQCNVAVVKRQNFRALTF